MQNADWQPTIKFTVPADWDSQRYTAWLVDLDLWLKGAGDGVGIAEATMVYTFGLTAVEQADGTVRPEMREQWHDPEPRDPNELI